MKLRTIIFSHLIIPIWGFLSFHADNFNYNQSQPDLWIMTHIQSNGWIGAFRSGSIAGNIGERKASGFWIGLESPDGTITGGGAPEDIELIDNKRLEAIKIKILGIPNASIEYEAHCQSYGWMGWKKDGDIAGTTGLSKRLEAIKIRLRNAPGWGVRYRVRAESNNDLDKTLGKALTGNIPTKWKGWAKDGQVAGTTGQKRRVSHIQIQLYKK